MFKDFQVMMISKDVSDTCKFIKKETLAQVFSCNFANFLKTPFYIEQIWWLLLIIQLSPLNQ